MGGCGAAIDGRLLFAADDGVGGLELRMSDGTREGTVAFPEIAAGPASSAPAFLTAAGSRIFFSAAEAVRGRELYTVDRQALGGRCQDGPLRLCLQAGRFAVQLEWRDFQGQVGPGHVVEGVRSADSGLLWFFSENNWEMLVKVLDGCRINGRYWVFAAATTNVGYTLRVTDVDSGAVREYTNPVGRSAAALTDTGAFSTCP